MKRVQTRHCVGALIVLCGWLVLSPRPANAQGKFINTRITFTFSDDNFLIGPGESKTSSPSAYMGNRNLSILDRTNPSNFDTLWTQLVLYKRFDYGSFFVPEAALALRMQLNRDKLSYTLYDDSSYIRLNWYLNKKHTRNISAVFFPVDADKFRLGFNHDLTWGGTAVFPRNFSRHWAPGVKVHVDFGWWYAFAGFKTVLPSKASAKLSFRLVGTQDPDAIRKSFRHYLESSLPDGFTVEYRTEKGSAASQMSIEDPAFEKARLALSDEWPRPAAYVGCGGSIPIAGYFKSILGMDSMLIGFGRDDDQIHSPNEKYHVESFHKGMRSWARILSALTT